MLLRGAWPKGRGCSHQKHDLGKKLGPVEEVRECIVVGVVVWRRLSKI